VVERLCRFIPYDDFCFGSAQRTKEALEYLGINFTDKVAVIGFSNAPEILASHLVLNLLPASSSQQISLLYFLMTFMVNVKQLPISFVILISLNFFYIHSDYIIGSFQAMDLLKISIQTKN